MKLETRNPEQQRNLPAILIFASGTLLFIYILLRSIFVSITHDEALTVLNYVNKPGFCINDVTYTNNHLLNTWLAKGCFRIFGFSEWAFRLPNVLAGGLYIFYGAKLLKRILGNTWFAFGIFLALTLNEYVIDFFGLCRGYGISLGLLMTSLYFLFRYFENEDRPFFGILAVLLIAAAMLANYTFFLLLLLFTGLVLLHELITITKYHQSNPAGLVKRPFVPIIVLMIGVIPGYWMYETLFDLKAKGGFDFGGHEGFWADTVPSLFMWGMTSLSHKFHTSSHLLSFLSLLSAGVFIAAAIFSIVQLRKEHSAIHTFGFTLFLLLFGCGFATWYGHIRLDLPFSTDRAVLYLVPLFALLLGITLGRQEKYRRVFRGIIFALFLLPAVSCLLSLNLRKTIMWSRNAGMRQAMELMKANFEKEKSKRPFAAVDYMEFPAYDFYCRALNMEKLGFIQFDETGYRPGANYYIGKTPQPGYEKQWANDSVTFWKLNLDYTDRFLVKLKQPEERLRKELSPGVFGWETDTLNEFVGLIRDTIRDTLPAGALVRLSYSLFVPHAPSHAYFAFAFRRGENVHLWRAWSTSWLILKKNEWYEAYQTVVLPQAGYPGEILEGVLWSDKRTPTWIKDFSIEVEQRDFTPKK